MLVPVILSGGSGTRLWPMSRRLLPKQFLDLLGNETMLEATASRLLPLASKDSVWVVTGQEQAHSGGYKPLQNFKYVVEPSARNTAPAIAMMAAYLNDFEHDPTMLILPADHVITDVGAFHTAIKNASKAAEKGHLVTFGIQPTHPETGFGYIQATEKDKISAVEAFKEKPDQKTAEQFIADGNYYWNSGMFVAKASVMLSEIQKHAPDIASVLEHMRADWHNGIDWKEVVSTHFDAMPNVSIDYALMEKSDNVVVVPCSIGWNDVGSWDAVYDIASKDEHGNAVKGNHIGVDTQNCLLMGSKRIMATIGLEDLLVVDTPDALLISKKGRSQDVKAIVDTVKTKGGEEHIVHRTAQRPWGSYTVLDDNTTNTGFKIKRIEVTPGGRLSLQSHQHRSEHWTVVSGTATVTCGDKVMHLHPNESTYIPVGEKHRLENLGKIPVQLVEVQVGEYLGEDDIERYDDVYGRDQHDAPQEG